DCCDGFTPKNLPQPAKKSNLSTTMIIVIVLLCMCFLTVPIITAIAIPNLLSARKQANKISTIGALKTITTAQTIFRKSDKEENNNLNYDMLSELGNAILINSLLSNNTKQ